MHCDMLKIQDGGAIVEKLNCKNFLKKEKILQSGNPVLRPKSMFPHCHVIFP